MFLFKNLRLLDPNWKEARGGYEVLIEGDTIKEVSAKPIKARGAAVVDCVHDLEHRPATDLIGELAAAPLGVS